MDKHKKSLTLISKALTQLESEVSEIGMGTLSETEAKLAWHHLSDAYWLLKFGGTRPESLAYGDLLGD